MDRVLDSHTKKEVQMASLFKFLPHEFSKSAKSVIRYNGNYQQLELGSSETTDNKHGYVYKNPLIILVNPLQILKNAMISYSRSNQDKNIASGCQT